jgi:hypothetical protein
MLEILNEFFKENNYDTLTRDEKIVLLKKESKELIKTAFSENVDSKGIFKMKRLFDDEVAYLETIPCKECPHNPKK